MAAVTAIAVFFQFFGGAVFIAISETIFVSRLTAALHEYAPSLDAKKVIAAGATGLRTVVKLEGGTGEVLDGAIAAYNVAVTTTFYLMAAGAVVATFFALGIEWRSVKEEQRSGEVGSE